MLSGLNRIGRAGANRRPCFYSTFYFDCPSARDFRKIGRQPEGWLYPVYANSETGLGRVNTKSQSCDMLRCMEITEAQYQHIASTLPRQRGNVKVNNLQLLNALLYVAEHGCKWRGLPKRFGPWHTIYTRMNRWSKNGVLDQVFEQLQREQVVRIRI